MNVKLKPGLKESDLRVLVHKPISVKVDKVYPTDVELEEYLNVKIRTINYFTLLNILFANGYFYVTSQGEY